MFPPPTTFARLCAATLLVAMTPAGIAESALPPEAIGRLGSHRFVHPEIVMGLAFQDENRRILSICGDNIVRVWDVEFAKVLHQFPVKRSAVAGEKRLPTRLKKLSAGDGPNRAESPDGRFVVGAGGPGAQLRDTKNGKVIARWAGDLRSCDFSADGRLLAVAMDYVPLPNDRSTYWVTVVDASTDKEKWKVTGGYHQVAFSPDGSVLAATGHEQVTIFDANTGTILRALKYGGNEHVYALAFSSDGKTLAAGGVDARIRMWNTADWSEKNPCEGHEGPVTSVSFSPDGKTIATGGKDRSLRLWNWRSGSELWKVPNLGSHWAVTQTVFSPDGTKLAVEASLSNRGDPVTIRKTADGKKISSLDPRTLSPPLAFMPDSKQVATGMRDGAIAIWDAETGARLRDVGKWKKEIEGLQILSAEEAAWSGEYKGVGIRNLVTGKDFLMAEKEQHSSDGKLTAAGGVIMVGGRVWDVATGKQLRQGKRPGNRHECALSPDGRMMAWVKDGHIILWELLSQKEIHALGPLDGDINLLTFSPDSATLASAGHDGSVLLWDITGGERESRVVENFDTLWKQLGSDDGWAARKAVWQLANAASLPISKFRKKLQPAAEPTAKHLTMLRGQFEDSDYDVREDAARELFDLGEVLSSEQMESLRRPLHPEYREQEFIPATPAAPLQITDLTFAPGLTRSFPSARSAHFAISSAYDPYELGPPPELTPGPQRLQQERAVEALEHGGKPEAIALLETLATGWAQHPQTVAAKAALKRIKQKQDTGAQPPSE